MSNFKARVEITDHLDWIDIMTNQDHGGPHDAWSTISVRGIDQLYELKHAIEVYLWEHEKVKASDLEFITKETINGIVAEYEVRARDGRVVGYWAYGYWDPALPYQGEEEYDETRS